MQGVIIGCFVVTMATLWFTYYCDKAHWRSGHDLWEICKFINTSTTMYTIKLHEYNISTFQTSSYF